MSSLPPGNETVPLDWASQPDEDHMRRVQAGDTRALEYLIHRWSPRLAAFFYRLTGDPYASDDLLQESFLRLWASRDAFRPDARFSPWIHAIARNLATDRARARDRKPLHRAATSSGQSTTLLGRIADSATTPFAAASKLEMLARLDEALRSVPEAFREAVVLCDLQRLSYEDAGEVLGVPAKTVSSRLARGREHLRQALAAFRSGPIS